MTSINVSQLLNLQLGYAKRLQLNLDFEKIEPLLT
jgi:hypothetical protein